MRKTFALLVLLTIALLSGCATSKSTTSATTNGTNAAPAPDSDRYLRLIASIGASEAVLEDAKNSEVLQEVSDALNVFCGGDKYDSLFLITLIKGLPDRLHISEKTKRRLLLASLVVEEMGGHINPSDYVAWGSAGCALRDGIKRGLALAKSQ